MKKEWILTIGVVVVTLVISLSALRWFAPRLLGIPSDLRMVRVAEEVPPFFDGVFRDAIERPGDFLISDPVVVNRAEALYPDITDLGPNDLLGFRNRAVPNIADIICLGDSITYGNNAMVDFTWPGRLQALVQPPVTVYSMAVGAWSATNYLKVFEYAVHLSPQIVIVAFYTGNDPLTDFRNAYTYSEWAHLRPDGDLELDDAPAVAWPPPAEDITPTLFADGVHMVFTPAYRHLSNRRDDPVVAAGYEIIANAARLLRDMALAADITPVFTVIPTKELVYAPKASAEGLEISDEYAALIRDERLNVEALGAGLARLEGAVYVDVLTPMQNAALAATPLYRTDDGDGHPVAEGYRVIAEALEPAVTTRLAPTPRGVVIMKHRDGRMSGPYLVRANELLLFPSSSAPLEYGWEHASIKVVPQRVFANLPIRRIPPDIDRRELEPPP